MAVVKILQYPNSRLRTKAEPVEQFDDELQRIIDDMFETHYNAPNCAALAATQLDFEKPKAITVIDFSEKKNEPLCLVNPEIIHREGEQTEMEGCMSVGGNSWDSVTRAAKVTVRAFDRYGKPLEIEAEGFLAKCFQHEIDHLHGKLFIDYLSKLKRERIKKRIEKLNRMRD